jgi:hypothetical protein
MAHQMQQSDFLKIEDEHSRFMLENAYQAITHVEAWDFLRTFNDNQNGFMFSSNPMTGKIMSKMEELGYTGHSGFSFAWTMRNMEFLAKHGRDEFLSKFE